MTLTEKGKSDSNIPIMGSLKINLFNWNDGFYNVELLRWNGIEWEREGQMKCMTKIEYEQFKREVER